jgi:hypothetical protein
MQNHQDDVSTADAAKRLGLGEDAIRKRIKRGVLNGYKRDNKWYVVLDDLDRIEQGSGRVPPRTSAKLLSHLATAEGGYLWTIETPQPDGKWAQEKGARTTVGIEDSSAEALATAATVCGMCEAKHT